MWKPQSSQPATELDLGFMSALLRFWTTLASNDLRPELGISLQLAGALSPRETLEMSLRLTAQLPGFQTMGNLSLHYSLPDLGVSGMFLDFASWEVTLLLLPCSAVWDQFFLWRFGQKPQKRFSQPLVPRQPSAPSAHTLCHPLSHTRCGLGIPPRGFSLLTLNIGSMGRLVLGLRSPGQASKSSHQLPLPLKPH